MASSKIRIKRTSTTAITTGTLAVGELGYSSLLGTQSNTGDRLFIGIGADDASTTPFVVGGKYFTDMLDHVAGTLTASSALIVDSNSKIDVINVGNLTLTGSTGVISSTNSNGNITLTPNGTGYVQISGTNAFILPNGTTAQQSPAISGAIRYNTTTNSFEGYTGTSGAGNWASLGGVRSVDNLTYIIAETSPGVSDDILHFYASNNTSAVEVAKLDIAALKLLQTTANTGNATSGALQVAGGAGIAGNIWTGGNLSVVGTSAFTDLATFSNGLTISGNSTAAAEYFKITDGSTDKFVVDTASGNTTISGTLHAGNTTTGTLSSTSATFSGDIAVATTKFTIAAATGDTTIAGTLGVTGTTSLTALNLSGDFAVATNKFTVASATGNTAAAGTLSAGGDFAIATNKFTVAALTGNTAVAGTLNVTGQTDVTGNFNVNTNKFTVAASTGNTAVAGTLNVTGTSTLAAVTAGSGAFSGDFSVATSKFTVASATGNTEVGGTLNVIGTSSFNGTVSLNGYKLTNLGDPTAATDAVTKDYVDSLAQGLHTHAPVDFVLLADAGAATYTAGPATAPYLGDFGPGSYLTFSAAPTFTYTWLGGAETATFTDHGGERVLLIGQTDKKQNGIYVWATATTFVRAIDADMSYAQNGFTSTLTSGVATIVFSVGTTEKLRVGMPAYKVGGSGVLGAGAQIASIDSPTQITLTTNHGTTGAVNLAFGYGDLGGGDFVYVNDSGYGYVQSVEGVVFGTTEITFTQFAGQGSWLAGAGLTLTGNSFSVNTSNGLTVSGGNVQIASSAAGAGLTFDAGVFDIGGTTNRITINADSIDIASTYVGQTSITTLGTIGTGTWQGTVVASAYGGTGFSTYAAGDILYASATNTLSKLAKGNPGQVMLLDPTSGLPSWADVDGGTF
jgi:hypothetical protein